MCSDGIFIVGFDWNGKLKFVLCWLIKYGDFAVYDDNRVTFFF